MSLHQTASVSHLGPGPREEPSEPRPAQCPPTTGDVNSSCFSLDPCALAPTRQCAGRIRSPAPVGAALRPRPEWRPASPKAGRTGSHQAWRRGRFAQMTQDLPHGTSVGDDGDDSHLAAAAWTDERKDLMDPREQHRPGGAGDATVDRFLFPRCLLCPLGRPTWRSGRGD